MRQEKKAITSLFQRRLRLGYTRAARVVDILEQRGYVAAGEGAKPREILIDLDEARLNRDGPERYLDIDETVGKRLQQARLKKQLSVEEVARTTKLRPERILDLENDTYAHFPNLAYAKGFLIIYAKFLGVDIPDFTESLQSPNPVGSERLRVPFNAAPGAAPRVRRRRWDPRRPNRC